MSDKSVVGIVKVGWVGGRAGVRGVVAVGPVREPRVYLLLHGACVGGVGGQVQFFFIIGLLLTI